MNSREARVLVTSSGGIGGINFVRALRLAEQMEGRKYFIVGTDYSRYYILFPELDVRYNTPRHSDPEFFRAILEIAERHSISFIHPHSSVEAKVIAQNREMLDRVNIKYYLPEPDEIAPDKLDIYMKLKEAGVPVPRTYLVDSLESIDEAFSVFGTPLWIRARVGAGGRLSLKVSTPQEAKLWVQLNHMQGRAEISDFIIQEYLPGRDLAFDSLWYEGRLVTSYVRERLEYPFKHISLTGITGTPSVARIIHDDEAAKVGIRAVEAFSRRPHGFYSVDLKQDSNGRPKVTEVDGKWHTTAPLWGYAMSKVFRVADYNLAHLYLKLGLGEDTDRGIPQVDLFPEECYLIRQMDAGVILKCGGDSWRII